MGCSLRPLVRGGLRTEGGRTLCGGQLRSFGGGYAEWVGRYGCRRLLSLSGQLGAMTVGLEGLIVDDDSLGGTYSAVPLTEAGTFVAVRVDSNSGTELDGEWVLMLEDIFSDGCTLEIEHLDGDLTTRLDCESLTPASGVTLEGTLDGSAITLSGPFSLLGANTLLLEATVSEDGDSIAGTWEISPLGLSGSFTAARQAGTSGSS